ncbi:IS66 family insertion sequence element accessory protein TnpA [Belliella pelovolcani]|uniref:Uncharacterized protein n=1 Tax=Belliella pelovolcani TaxID=529505 RepID=A0A1N7MQQ0_9BACT|nr:hypothetical protein [Belliella pelovolcani]SIS88447.1 hypothetical protein SAMN05421761_10748 [Belliella pelovolcani]
MKKLLKEIIETINEGVYFVDDKGNKIEPVEAAKKGIMIKPIDSRLNAIEALKEVGIDINDKELIKDLFKVIGLLSNEKSIKLEKSSKRKTYKPSEIKEHIDKYESSGMSKAQYARENDLNYQTFNRWFN